jgi:AraC-like DNA-binding protein
MTEATAPGAPLPAAPFVFDTSAFAGAERIERWRMQMAPIATVEAAPSGLHPWNVRIRAWNVGGMLVSEGEYGAQLVTRTAAHVRKEPIDHYSLHLAHEGVGLRMQAGDRDLQLAPGQPLLSDLAQPKAVSHGAGRITSLFIPRAALDRLLPQELDLHGVVPQGACSAMLVSHLESMVRRLPGLTQGEVAGAFEATLHLLAASLSPSVATLGMARPAVAQTLMRQMLRYIDDNVRRADLGSELICEVFGVSRATLYRMFEPLGGVAHHIRSQRLARIHSELLAPSGRVVLARLAEAYGFKNAAHFSRAFREHFGYAPTDMRGTDSTGAAPVDLMATTPSKWWRSVLV